jgi:hypothetical protein
MGAGHPPRIWFNFDFIPTIRTGETNELPGFDFGDLEGTLAHESGHALGDADEETAVRDWENPIRRAKGLKPRQGYSRIPQN